MRRRQEAELEVAEMEMLSFSLVVTRMRGSGMRTSEEQHALDVLEVKSGRPC